MSAPGYEVVGPLGTGGMAEVLLAKRVGPNGFERLLAVKRIRPDRAHDPDLVRMLLDEARNAATLAHLRIVQVFDIELRDGAVMIAMEYLHGRTLDDVLARQPRFSLAAAVAIAAAIADGLHHAHTRPSPIVHRDVAPSNVMITYDGSVKLIDFGIAKSANNISNTVFGTFKGRLGYSSPEQCRCEPVDAGTDIYSLGVLLYEMATGARVFAAADEQAMLAAMTAARIASPRSIDREFPPELEAIVMRALAPDRAQRYPTAQAMQQDLEAFARARAMNLSEGALAREMHGLFAEDVQTWIQARRAGVTLEDHVLSQVTKTGATMPARPGRPVGRDNPKSSPQQPVRDTFEDRATTALPPRRRSPQRSWLLPAVVVVLVVAAFIVTRVLMG